MVRVHGWPGSRRRCWSSSRWPCVVTIIAFLWPADFYYHYAAFLTPFLALALSRCRSPGWWTRLPPGLRPAGTGRAADAPGESHGRRPRSCWPPWWACQTGSESLAVRDRPRPARSAPPRQRPSRQAPCVLTDQASYTIATTGSSPTAGLLVMVDGVGSDYSLSHGRNAAHRCRERARRGTAVDVGVAQSAQFVWLSSHVHRRDPVDRRRSAAYFPPTSFRLPRAVLALRAPGGHTRLSPRAWRRGAAGCRARPVSRARTSASPGRCAAWVRTRSTCAAPVPPAAATS